MVLFSQYLVKCSCSFQPYFIQFVATKEAKMFGPTIDSGLKAWWARVNAPKVSAAGIEAISRLAHDETFAQQTYIAATKAEELVAEHEGHVTTKKGAHAEAKKVVKNARNDVKQANKGLVDARVLRSHVNSVASKTGITPVPASPKKKK